MPINVPEFTSVEEFNNWFSSLKKEDIQNLSTKDVENISEQLRKLGVDFKEIPELAKKTGKLTKEFLREQVRLQRQKKMMNLVLKEIVETLNKLPEEADEQLSKVAKILAKNEIRKIVETLNKLPEEADEQLSKVAKNEIRKNALSDIIIEAKSKIGNNKKSNNIQEAEDATIKTPHRSVVQTVERKDIITNAMGDVVSEAKDNVKTAIVMISDEINSNDLAIDEVISPEEIAKGVAEKTVEGLEEKKEKAPKIASRTIKKIPKQARSRSFNNTKIPADMDLSKYHFITIEGNCEIPEGIKLPNEVYFKDAKLPANIDLLGSRVVFFEGNCEIPQGVKLPSRVNFMNATLSANTNLSKCEQVMFMGNCEIPKGAKLAGNTSFMNIKFTENTDLSGCRQAVFSGRCEIPQGAKLPSKVNFMDATLNTNTNLSTCKEALFSGKCKIPEEIKLPKKVHFKATTIPSNMDLRNCRKLTLTDVTTLPENVKLPNVIIEVKGNCSNAVKNRIEIHNAAVEQTNFSKRVTAQASRLNARYDRAFDKIVNRIEKDTPEWAKALEKVMSKPNTWTTEKIMKTADKFSKTKSGRAIMKAMEERGITTAAKGVGKSALKKIPLICFVIGCYCAYERLEDGEPLKAFGEFVSGTAGNIPVWGTLVSFGIDGVLLASDLEQTSATCGVSIELYDEAREEQKKKRQSDFAPGKIYGDTTWDSTRDIRDMQAIRYGKQKRGRINQHQQQNIQQRQQQPTPNPLERLTSPQPSQPEVDKTPCTYGATCGVCLLTTFCKKEEYKKWKEQKHTHYDDPYNRSGRAR